MSIMRWPSKNIEYAYNGLVGSFGIMGNRPCRALEQASKEVRVVCKIFREMTSLEEPSVAASIKLLEEAGINMELLQKLSEEDLKGLSPNPLKPVDLLKLKYALRSFHADQQDRNIYKKASQYVGKVEVEFQNTEVQHGNCVLVGKEGYAVTAFHVTEDHGAGEKTKKRKKNANGLLRIRVVLPNTNHGCVEYDAEICHSWSHDDLALIKAVNPQQTPVLESIEVLSKWEHYYPEEGDKVAFLSFPPGKGEAQPISHNISAGEDLPWLAEGSVSCVDSATGQVFASYTSFAGCSGGLVIHSKPGIGFYPGLHLGIYHETQDLEAWNKNQLDKLNMGLGQKGAMGYFSLRVRQFLKEFLYPNIDQGRVPAHHLHHQVVRRVKRMKQIEADGCATVVEAVKEASPELEEVASSETGAEEQELADSGMEQQEPAEFDVETLDLFGPWPGLES
ncbi:hypothetical protein GOP47_0014768 [Adiantum capillus-veneris]|uniref:Uncharacterized protein n=1 Tax=Adiantum capillus-veneris TaxID=13818 RepID=A0A9D4UM44_ADICA|nr:hypothetical protein GOP47_0014768 [Adiantum capillus-veneris]